MEKDLELGFGHAEGDSKGWFGRVREIIKNSKSLTELIEEEKFLVECVTGVTEVVNITVDLNEYTEYGDVAVPEGKRSETGYIYYGSEADISKIHEVDGGFKFTSYLKVIPFNKDCPIRKLTFFSYTPALGGHIISAKIARHEQHTFPYSKSRSHKLGYERSKKIFYTDRPYAETEIALNVSIFNGDKVIRSDKSVEYKHYFKE